MRDKIILLVEDNPDDEELTIRALKGSNLRNEVVVVRDGAEALDWLFARGAFADRDRSVAPQVVLLDLKLPKVDGLEVLRAIRSDEGLRRTPVVMLTSSRQQRDVAAGYDLGINSYICKPVSFVEFAESVRNLGLYWLLLNEPPPETGGRFEGRE